MWHYAVFKESAAGITLATVSFILLFSSVPLPAVHAATTPLFSFTVLTPTSNPVRREWASVVVQSYQSVNIQANLVYIPFSTVNTRIFAAKAPEKTYANGGFDAVFLGFGGSTVIPDFGTNAVLNYRSDDFSPSGNNIYGYSNATYDALAKQYANTFDQATRQKIAQQMVAVVAQDRPDLILEYPPVTTAVAANIFPWGQQKAYSESTTGEDTQHFKVNSTSFTLNIGETGDINNVDALPTGTSNSIYNRYFYEITSAATEELDVRNMQYFKALATSIVSTPDHLNWTVSFRPHTFQDGVPVTADDYVFTLLSNLRTDAASVALGTFQTLLGINTQFTFLNGSSDYVMNGTYSHGTAPAGFKPTSTVKSINATTFAFHMPSANSFTDPELTDLNALPMHIYEKVPANTWVTSFLSTLSTTPTTVTWNTKQYGGNGSYAYVYGPIGDGPYIYKGYNVQAGVGTLVRFDNYWNATGLKAIGEFGVQTEHVYFIQTKDAAIAAMKNGQVNFLDGQYTFNRDDINTISSFGGVAITSVDPSSGWQELALNDAHPVFGTGTATPLGTSTPSKAAQAARDVREALSYLIPRQYIITNLLQGLGSPGITQICTCFSWAYPSNIQPDPYNVTAAKSFLAAAGYNTGVAPPISSSSITLPSVPSIPPISINGTSVNLNVKVPSFLLGNSFTLSGVYAPTPLVTMIASGGYAVVLEQSTTNGSTWQPVSLTTTNTGGFYTMTYTPTTTGSVWYRLFYPGVNASFMTTNGYSTPSAVEGLAPPANLDKSTWLNSTDGSYGQVSQLNIGTLGDVITSLAAGISQGFSTSNGQINKALGQVSTGLTTLGAGVTNLSSATQKNLNTLQSSIATVQSNAATKNDINNLSNQVATLTDVAYAALGVSIVLGLVAIMLSRRGKGV